jgi:hypothetical protein
MRFYERAQAFGAFGALANLEPTPQVLDAQALSALKNLFDFNAAPASQAAVAADH